MSDRDSYKFEVDDHVLVRVDDDPYQGVISVISSNRVGIGILIRKACGFHGDQTKVGTTVFAIEDDIRLDTSYEICKGLGILLKGIGLDIGADHDVLYASVSELAEPDDVEKLKRLGWCTSEFDDGNDTNWQHFA